MISNPPDPSMPYLVWYQQEINRLEREVQELESQLDDLQIDLETYRMALAEQLEEDAEGA